MTSRKSSAGFTLVEVLVVIAILGLLVGIVVPAVQSARESARRMQCLSRLSNIGVALHNFEQTYKAYPAAQLGLAAPQGGLEVYSAFAHLLPYVDRTVIYNRINFRNGGNFSVTPQSLDSADQSISVFLCPSDAGNSGCNFRFCTGSGSYGWSFTDASRRNGAFTLNEMHRPSDFTDGLSNTVGASEKIKSPGQQGGWSPKGQFWYSGVAELLRDYPPTEVVVQACESLTGTPPRYGWHAGNSWLLGYYDFTLYNHSVPPNSVVPDCSVHVGGDTFPPGGADAGVFAARSYHPNGVNCLFMDGAVRFVHNGIDLELWRSLATRADGEATGEF